MKRKFLNLTLIILAIITAIPIQAATTPKREHRSVWITTAWCMCWPTTQGTSSSVATTQKNEAIQYLDLLQENGFNAVYFQVRGMSDAMYKSSYEPWSSYLTGSRGSTPSYDPLEFWIEECHKRGMELYAWVNPYRYESSVSGASWTGSQDYRTTHPDWIMEYNNASILNPGIAEVQTRIVDVCREIVGNYDVDGLVFDDYFYLNSVPTSYDSSLYRASGTTLSQGDWRRENVNSMVRKVYQMVQSTKPYVKFGISPAGVAKTSASKYGISTGSISSASDWQYEQICSDPLAWLGEGTIDFISPQIYWKTDHSTNAFGKLSEWWSDACADVFGRHFYASHSISYFDGANNTSSWSEMAKQVQCNRDADTQSAPGCVFFGSRDLTGKRNEGFAPYIKSNKFQNIALPPTVTWKSNYAYNPGKVTGLALSGTTLSWNGYDNMRYVVYAVPNGTSTSGDISSQYIIGNPYATSINVSGYTSGYQLGVSVFDRYGNEYEVTWLGGDDNGNTGGGEDETKELEQTTINTPSDGSTVQSGFTFGWSANPVSGVSYRLEIATSNTFSNIIFSATTSATSYSSANISLNEGTTYYWRVVTSKEGYTSSTSWVGSFTMATSGGSSTTPTDVVKDPSTYNNVNGYSIESLWMYSVNTSNFPSQLGGDQRGMAALNGKVYISQRDGHLLEFSGETGEFIRSITLTGDCLTDNDGNSLQYKCQDLFVDAANNLCISNLTLDCSSVPLTICTININTGATTRVFNMTTTLGGRIDFVAIRGDVNTTGCEIWAAVANSNYVYRWTRNASTYWAVAYTSIDTYYPTGSATTNSTAPRIMPISNTQFILDGHNSAPALYTFNASGTATYVDGFGSNSSIAPTANNWNGVSQATLNGTPIFAYVSGISPNTFTIVTNPSNFNFSKMSKLWTVPANGLGSEANSYITSKPTMVNNSDGSVTMYIYTPNNGLAAYKLKSATVVTPQLDAVSLSTPVGGNTVAKGFSFGWSSISGATYTLEVSKSSSFSSVDFIASTTSNSYSSSNFNLATNTTYYWRVKASKDGYLSSTSSVASFKTAQETLAAVTLNSPIGGATVEKGFTFNWSSISGATYTLEISAVATFASKMYSIETTQNSYSSSNFDFNAGTKYYWRVIADTDNASESISSVESFTTKQEEIVNPDTPSTGIPKEDVTYETINNLSIKNLWIYSIQKGNFHEELGRDQRAMATLNGKVYINERTGTGGVGYILEFDGNTGEYLRKIALTGEYLTTSDGYTLGYPCNNIFVDGANHLCVSNMVTSISASSQLNISIVDVETGATTRVFESALNNASLRFDNCMVWGDITKAGSKVFAAPSGANSTSSSYRKNIYCWTRDNDLSASITEDVWDDWTSSYKTVESLYPTSARSFGNAPRVFPVAINRLYVDGANIYPTLYKYGQGTSETATTEDTFASNPDICPTGMLSAGMCTGEINGRDLFIYSFNDNEAEFYNFAVALNPNDFSFEDMEILWKIPQAGLGNQGNTYVSSIPATQQNADGSLTLYIYVPNNGLAAYLIQDATMVDIENIDAETELSVNLINRTVKINKPAESIKVYSTAGTMVATASNCEEIDLSSLPCGVYIVEAYDNESSISKSIVLK